MKRLVIAAVLLPAITLVIRRAASTIRARCSTACEHMLADMPESFPPNRILADLEALRKDSTRMLDLIERETADHA